MKNHVLVLVYIIIGIVVGVSYQIGVKVERNRSFARIEMLKNTIKFGNWLKSDRKKPIVFRIHGEINDKKLLDKIEKIRKQTEEREIEEQEEYEEEHKGSGFVYNFASCEETCEEMTKKAAWANCVSNCYERSRIFEECSDMEEDDLLSCSESIKSDALNYYVELRDENKETGETGETGETKND